jgi:hypothetical protein
MASNPGFSKFERFERPYHLSHELRVRLGGFELRGTAFQSPCFFALPRVSPPLPVGGAALADR